MGIGFQRLISEAHTTLSPGNTVGVTLLYDLTTDDALFAVGHGYHLINIAGIFVRFGR